MPISDVMAALEAAGREQTRKTYRRHGVQDPMFGVSYAELGKWQKRIKVDQALAEQLWATGNHDARILATMIADPAAVTEATLDTWVKQVDSYPVSGALAYNLVCRTPFAMVKQAEWIESPIDWIASAGWQLLAECATLDQAVPDSHFAEALVRIEREIHTAPNRVRHQMNGALIAIGGSREHLTDLAVAAAARIGKVVVDHGDTACKTPDAVPYIRKMRERVAKKKA